MQGEFSQRQIGIVADLPSNDNSSLLYIAPEKDSIAIPNLFSNKLYLHWRTLPLKKITGFVHKWRNTSVQ